MKEVAICIVALVAVVGLYRYGRRREVLMLKRWAEESHFQLLHCRQRMFSEAAPFSFWTTHRTPNYFVRVKDERGTERSGWVRLGNVVESTYWGGKNQVEVRWVEGQPQSTKD